MVHRSALEPTRLTPSNAGELLFDDVLWVARAKADVERDVGLAKRSSAPHVSE
jgi:arginine deiminase